MNGLYDRSTLEYWEKRTPLDIKRYFHKQMLPAIQRLPGLNRTAVRSLSQVEFKFPLKTKGSEPFSYTSFPSKDKPTIKISVLSLRFLGDLFLANAWLQVHNYSLEAVYDYVAMLKYNDPRRFPGGRYPKPLDALQIPKNAREDQRVKNLYLDFFHTAIVFILGHELGHIYWNHEPYEKVSATQSQRDEMEADRFALKIMDELDLPKIGMVLYFMASAHWTSNRWDFDSQEDYKRFVRNQNHPLTPERLRELSKYAKQSREQIAELANFLEDEEIQLGIKYVGKNTDLAFLAPKRSSSRPLQQFPRRRQSSRLTLPFHGTYEGQLIDASGSFPSVMVLDREGNRVTGKFTESGGVGVIRGVVKNDALSFEWAIRDTYGKGILMAEQQGSILFGSWGYRNSFENGGQFVGRLRQ